MTKVEIKTLIINDVNDYENIYLPISKIYNKIINGQEKILTKECLRELETDGLIKFESQRIHISITNLGKRAASIGYLIYENEMTEESKQAKFMEKEKKKLELKALQFNHTWRFIVILSAIISVAGFILSLLTYFKK